MGRQKADFKSSTDRSSSAWEVGIEWRPLSYSTLSFTSSKDITDTAGITGGNATTSNTNTLSWLHEWKSYLTSDVYVQSVDEDYEGTTREDETKEHRSNRQLPHAQLAHPAAGLSRTERQSNTGWT